MLTTRVALNGLNASTGVGRYHCYSTAGTAVLHGLAVDDGSRPQAERGKGLAKHRAGPAPAVLVQGR